MHLDTGTITRMAFQHRDSRSLWEASPQRSITSVVGSSSVATSLPEIKSSFYVQYLVASLERRRHQVSIASCRLLELLNQDLFVRCLRSTRARLDGLMILHECNANSQLPVAPRTYLVRRSRLGNTIFTNKATLTSTCGRPGLVSNYTVS
jgi:hypothetical protein